MSGLTSQLNKLGLGSKAATVPSSSSSTTASTTSSSTSTAPAPVQSSLTAALAANANRPRHKKSISGGNPEHGFDLGRIAPVPAAPGSTGSQTRTLQASKRQQSTNSNSKPILISSKSTGGRSKTGREGGPTLAQSAPTVHYVPPPAPSARPRIASFDPPPMALPPSPDTRGPLANVLRQSISKGPSSRAHKKNDAAAAQARQQRSLSMYPSSAPAHNINYMDQLAAAAAVGVYPSGSGLAGKQVFEEGEEGEDEDDTPAARQRRQQRQAQQGSEDHSETSSTTSSHRSEHKSGDEKSEQQPDEISVDSGGAEEPFDSEDSDVEYSVDGEEEVIIRPIERRMSDLSSSLTYSNMMNQADVGLLSKSPTIFSILKQDGTPAGASVLGMLSSSASSTGSSHLTGAAARVGLPPLAGKKSVTSASSSTRGIQIASGGKKAKHPGAYMGSPTDDLQFSISLDPNEDSILDQELEEEESTTPAEPIRENEFMNY